MNKKVATAKSIDEYIAKYPVPVQKRLQKLRETIQQVAPDAEDAMKYQIPTFVFHGNLVHFAGYEKHVGFYPTPSGIEHFKEELSAYKTAKGSVQFPHDAAIPYPLIKKIVKFRVKENLDRAAKKSGKKK